MEDEKLIRLIRNGNEHLFNNLLKKYDYILKSLAMRYRNVYYNLRNDYDDLYQEATMGLLYAVDTYKFDSKASFKTYLNITVRGYLNKYLRKRNSDNLVSLEDYEVNVKKTPETAVIYNDLEIKINDYKLSLDYPNSLIFELHINNFSNSEIASILDLSYKKIDNTLYMIRKDLKRVIK